MECRQITTRLSALLDGELNASDRSEVEDHLRACAECRHELALLRQLDDQLREQMRAVDQRARQLTDSVLAELDEPQPTASLRDRSSIVAAVARYGLAALAGFLLAVLLTPDDRSPFQQQSQQAGTEADRPGAAQTSSLEQSAGTRPAGEVAGRQPAVNDRSEVVARVTHATGSLSYKTPGDADWRFVDGRALPLLACPSNTQLKTLTGGLAELETADGCRIRINENTEIALRTTDNVELRAGDLWCRTPSDRELQVVTSSPVPPPGGRAPAGTPPHQGSTQDASALTVACQADSTCLTSRPSADGFRVLAATGSVSVRLASLQHDVPTGSGVEYVDGELRPQQTYSSVVDAERWVQPLMTLGGHRSPEINRRVEALLAHMGRAKLAHLYERDLRSLGEFSSLPLLSFLQREGPAADAALRGKAARILADTAPVWMIPDLLKLLRNSSPEVRYPLAGGLERLTGIPHELTPQQWDQQPEAGDVAIRRWQDWWSINQFTCQLPPHRVSSTAGSDGGGAGEISGAEVSPGQQPGEPETPPLHHNPPAPPQRP